MVRSFVLSCLTVLLYPDRPRPVPPVGMDWDGAYEFLLRNGLAGLFYVLGDRQPDLWPQALQERLQGWRYRALLRGDRCVRTVADVLNALCRAGVSVVVLKGWALIPSVYENDHGRRTYADIDLLVPRASAALAERVLRDLADETIPEPWPGHYRRYTNGRAYRVKSSADISVQDFLIGLHWQLLDTPFFFEHVPTERLFGRACPLRVAEVDVCQLDETDHLVYMCGHLALHHAYDEALFRYYEMAALVIQAGKAFDWDGVVRLAGEWRLITPVLRVLGSLNTLWPGIVPDQTLAEISTLRPELIERSVCRLITREKDNRSVRTMVNWLTMPGLGRRWMFLLETAFPHPAYMRQRYCPQHPRRWPLAYLQRVGRGFLYLGGWAHDRDAEIARK